MWERNFWITNAAWLTEVKDRPLTECCGREIYERGGGNKRQILNWSKGEEACLMFSRWGNTKNENELQLSAEMKVSKRAPALDWPNLSTRVVLATLKLYLFKCLFWMAGEKEHCVGQFDGFYRGPTWASHLWNAIFSSLNISVRLSWYQSMQ